MNLQVMKQKYGESYETRIVQPGDTLLITNINTDKNSYELVKSIIDFCKALNIRVIAEFVHSREVFNTIFDLGVDEFQGFYLAEPSLKIE